MPRVIDLTGQRFCRLYVIKRVGSTRLWVATWLCRCDCGTEKIVSSQCLRGGNSKSCGCLKIEGATRRCRFLKFKHGHSPEGAPSPEYVTWCNMHLRCYNAKKPDWKNYGGRGITVCERWHKSNATGFRNFLDDMGRKPTGLTIERINNDGNYEPSNCKWATRLEQRHNQRTYLGSKPKPENKPNDGSIEVVRI